MALCLIGLGSNLGDALRTLSLARDRLATRPQSRLEAFSRFYPTQPIGGPPGQAEFLNAAALLETLLAPLALLAALRQIEHELGRVRNERWSARTLDLDLLLFDEQVIQTPELVVPHPRFSFRKFALAPAVEIAPTMRHPLIGWTIEQLWRHVNESPCYVAFDGGDLATRRQLAEQVARAVRAEPVLGILELGTTIDGMHESLRAKVASLSAGETLLSDFLLPVVPPKLLIQCESPSHSQMLLAPYVGPVLTVNLSDSDAVHEIGAAIEAMR